MRLILILLLSFPMLLLAQTQVVRGTVADAETKFPLAGVTLKLADASGTVIAGTNSTAQGLFRFNEVPLGRYTLTTSYIGYEPAVVGNVILSSGKETVLNIEMGVSAVQTDVVDIVGTQQGEAANEMAAVSARSFSIEETNRYAGSRGEPARMAANFAGVQGADDSRNDIVVRGNSPQGVLYRLDGINIPNPNHFAIPGTSGGPVTILNNKFLANSDFYTGAFPASFGNGTAGVFDLRMRDGNNEQHEGSAQLGFLGTELMLEGPLNKKTGASYLAMYRYSTLKLFEFTGIQLGTDAAPSYQDGAFRLTFPQKNGAKLSFWGMGGLSKIFIEVSDQVKPDTAYDLYAADKDRDQEFGSNTGVLALTYQNPLSANTLLKSAVSVSRQVITADHYYVFRTVGPDSNYIYTRPFPQILDYTFDETRYSANVSVNHRFNPRITLNAGVFADYFQYDFVDNYRKVRPSGFDSVPATLEPWRTRWNTQTGAFLFQPFAQVKFRINEQVEGVAGVSSLIYTLNNNSVSPIEPRASISWVPAKQHKISLGTGIYSQTQPSYMYFYDNYNTDGDAVTNPYNTGMGLSKSFHLVGSHDFMVKPGLRIKTEAYYQYLFGVPVDQAASSFSMVNAGSGFARVFPEKVLVNNGTGRNFGLELTVERYFSKGFYFLATGSVFDAKYQGSDGVLRNTTFNGRYALNLLGAYEFALGTKGSALNLGIKYTTVGGRWYGPVNDSLSQERLEIIFEDATVNSLQFQPYHRLDLRIALRLNTSKRLAHEIALDLTNFSNLVFGYQNVLSLAYVPDHPKGPVQITPQLGFLPLFYYRIDF